MSVTVRLQPLGATLEAERGAALRDLLFPYGVEFPCAGTGRCRRCRVKVLEGDLPDTASREILGAEDYAAGWRLACRCTVQSGVTLEVGQWEAAILEDARVFAVKPRPGRAIAIDLGTTTLVAQLVDLMTGSVLGVRSSLNPQAVHGSDVMTRIEHGLTPEGAAELRNLIREELGGLVAELAGREEIESVCIVGNTAMMHLFAGIDVAPLSRAPFEPRELGMRRFAAGEVGWKVKGNPVVRFLPCLGGFVGSDILAGILATDLHESDGLVVLVDLGTNGEVVVGDRRRVLCASTAAGPAFEGGRISCGMRASTGAIAQAWVEDGRIASRVLGNTAARGICGSGLLDAVAAGLDLGLVQPSGRVSAPLELADHVRLTQRDIREVQLAKAAIAAGVRVLLSAIGAQSSDVTRFLIAGAFGNSINIASARRVGLIECREDIIEPMGNTALLGAKIALYQDDQNFTKLSAKIDHQSLLAQAVFQDNYVGAMTFPPG